MPISIITHFISAGSVLRKGVLSLLFIALFAPAQAIIVKKPKQVEQKMTVVKIVPNRSDDLLYEVTFQESTRFYNISRKAKPAYIRLLKTSEKNHKPVWVKRSSEYSEFIIGVRKPSGK